jgi:hypothetical protein
MKLVSRLLHPFSGVYMFAVLDPASVRKDTKDDGDQLGGPICRVNFKYFLRFLSASCSFPSPSDNTGKNAQQAPCGASGET